MRQGPAGPRAWAQSWLVHRWTAEELHARTGTPESAHAAAADWWLAPRTLEWAAAVEGLEHLLLAGRREEAVKVSPGKAGGFNCEPLKAACGRGRCAAT